MQKTNNAAASMQVPILLQIAGDDRLVNANSSKVFFKNLALSDKTLHVYDGLYHEIYNEPEDQRAKVLDDLESWLEAQIKNEPSSVGNRPA
jgi:alpha-beta hydrolase superfamily lysophospholipase